MLRPGRSAGNHSVKSTPQLSDDLKESVRQATDLVALVGESVTLQPVRNGREFVGLCPFHADHTPSMRVYPDRQSFRCWACNVGGDCFSFVMQRERIGFREALEMLALRANIELPKRFRDQSGPTEEKGLLYEMAAWAEQQYHECLLRDPMAERARNYLKERELTEATIAQFRLGYHPPMRDWLMRKAHKKYTPEQLLVVRLVGLKEDGNFFFDHYQDRVIFPIRDAQGRPISFGGRILPGADKNFGKYWNGPESPIFHKSRCLYGIEQARMQIQKDDEAIVVEGYTACISAHQAGIRNVVATLGTALTETHVTALKRLAARVVLAYDGDNAGQSATDKSLPRFLAQGVDLRVMTIPGKMDPDDFIRAHGAEAFKQQVAGAIEAWDHKLQSCATRHGFDSIIGRQRILQEMLEVLSDLPEPTGGLSGTWQSRESIMITRLVQQLGVKEVEVRRELQALRSRKAGQPNANSAGPGANSTGSDGESVGGVAHNTQLVQPPQLFPSKPTADDRAERDLLGVLLVAPDSITAIRAEILPAELRNAGLRRLLEVCFGLADQGCPPSYERVTLAVEDLEMKRLAAFVAEYAGSVRITAELTQHVLGYFRRRRELNAELAAIPPLQMPGGLAAQQSTESGSDPRERLRQATLAHQKRVAKPTL